MADGYGRRSLRAVSPARRDEHSDPARVEPELVSADATKIYFDQNAGQEETGDSLWSAPIDGGAATLVRDQTTVASVALVNDAPYWATGGHNTIEGPGAYSVSVPAPLDIVVEPSKKYFYVISHSDSFDEIVRIDIASKTVVHCATAPALSAIAAVAGHVYFGAYAGKTWGIYDLTTP